MPEPIFKVINVTKSFNKKIVLKDINLDVRAGEILGIIGSSGSGKTTLLNTLIGFLRPDNGDVLFRFEHLLDFKQATIFRSVFSKQEDVKKLYGFASQSPSFYHNLTAKENLLYFGSLYNLPKDALRMNVETLLNLMDLKQSENALAKNLSGGMERRLDIACSLMHDPAILILDEPTADLDPVLRDNIMELVRKINKKGTTIILASHHLVEMEKICTRIAFIKDHKIIDVDTPTRLKTKFSKHQEIHLESYPGNYDKIMKKLPKKNIVNFTDTGSKLIICTNTPQKVLQSLLRILNSQKEQITDIKVSRVSLDDIFISLTKHEAEEDVDVEEVKEQEHLEAPSPDEEEA